MTTDRKKAILFLSLTFIIGILIGSLIPAFYGRFRHRDAREMHGRDNKMERPEGNKREWLTRKIIQIVKPDSAQVKEIRPITMQAATQIGELEKNSNEKMIVIMDSLKLKLQPVLTAEQNQRLEDFSSKARQRWGRDGRGGR